MLLFLRKTSWFFALGLLLGGVFGAQPTAAQTCYSGATWQGPSANPVLLNRTKPVYTECTGIQNIDSNLDINTSVNSSAGVHINHDGSNRYPALQATLSAGVMVATFGSDVDSDYNNTGYTIRVVDTSGNPEIQLQYDNTDADYHWSLYADQNDDSFKIWGGGDNALTVLQSGNIGIGTTVPAESLSIGENMSGLSQSDFFSIGDLSSNGNRRAVFRYYKGNTDASSYLSVRGVSAATDHLVVKGDGKVGVGLSGPNYTFDVSGQIHASEDYFVDDGNSIRADSDVDTDIYVGNYADGNGFVYGDPYTASLQVEGDVRANQLCMQGDCKSAWTDITPTEAGGWTDDGLVVRLTTATDKVGIGTPNPDGSLHVYDTGSSGSSTRIRLEYDFTGVPNGEQDSVWDLEADSTGGAFKIINNGNDRVQITPAGNVSLGTTISPQIFNIGEPSGAHLMLLRDDSSTVTNEELGFLLFDTSDNPSTNDAAAMIGGFSAETQNSGDKGGYLAFFTKPRDTSSVGSNAVQHMRIDHDGQVGIGIDPTDYDPTEEPLNVIQNMGSGSSVDFLGIGDWPANGNRRGIITYYKAGTDNGSYLGFKGKANGGIGLLIQGDGDVGIGSGATNPSSPLAVVDTMTGSNGIVYIANTDGGTDTEKHALRVQGATAYYAGSLTQTYGIYVQGGDAEDDATAISYALYADAGASTNGGTVWAGYFDGNVYVNGTGTAAYAWTASSDKRFKYDIEKLEHMLERMQAVDAVSFKWRQDEFPEKHFGDGVDFGFIAQEFEQEFPELVYTDSEGYKSLAYDKITAILWEALKEQHQQVENLESRMQQVEYYLGLDE